MHSGRKAQHLPEFLFRHPVFLLHSYDEKFSQEPVGSIVWGKRVSVLRHACTDRLQCGKVHTFPARDHVFKTGQCLNGKRAAEPQEPVLGLQRVPYALISIGDPVIRIFFYKRQKINQHLFLCKCLKRQVVQYHNIRALSVFTVRQEQITAGIRILMGSIICIIERTEHQIFLHTVKVQDRLTQRSGEMQKAYCNDCFLCCLRVLRDSFQQIRSLRITQPADAVSQKEKTSVLFFRQPAKL